MAKEYSAPALKENIERFTAFAEEEMEQHGCPIKIVMLMNIVIDEICSNIVNYAYPDKNGEAVLSIDFSEDPRSVKLVFTDSGIPFDPLEKQDPDITLSADERGTGGLGIFIVKKKTDHMEYQYENGKNRLTLVKYY